MNSNHPPSFNNIHQAIRVLRKGKKDARWYEAAEFLIERATPEVQLMLEVGRAMAERENPKKAYKQKPPRPLRDVIFYGVMVLFVTAAVFWAGLNLVSHYLACTP